MFPIRHLVHATSPPACGRLAAPSHWVLCYVCVWPEGLPWSLLLIFSPCYAQNSKGAGVEQRVLQALMAKRFPKIVAQLERADSSVEVCTLLACC